MRLNRIERRLFCNVVGPGPIMLHHKRVFVVRNLRRRDGTAIYTWFGLHGFPLRGGWLRYGVAEIDSAELPHIDAPIVLGTPSAVTLDLTIPTVTLTAESDPQITVEASFDLTWDMGVVSRPIDE